MMKKNILIFLAKITLCLTMVILGIATGGYLEEAESSSFPCSNMWCQESVNACRAGLDNHECKFNGLPSTGICNETTACSDGPIEA